jgi:hypothetical protein
VALVRITTAFAAGNTAMGHARSRSVGEKQRIGRRRSGMKSLAITVALIVDLLGAGNAVAQEHPRLFMTPTEDGFEAYLSAAVIKKQFL